jgi:hypothetical protein
MINWWKSWKRLFECISTARLARRGLSSLEYPPAVSELYKNSGCVKLYTTCMDLHSGNRSAELTAIARWTALVPTSAILFVLRHLTTSLYF